MTAKLKLALPNDEPATAKTKAVKVRLDADLVAIIDAAATRIGADLGFRPSTAQTLRYLLTKERKDK